MMRFTDGERSMNSARMAWATASLGVWSSGNTALGLAPRLVAALRGLAGAFAATGFVTMGFSVGVVMAILRRLV